VINVLAVDGTPISCPQVDLQQVGVAMQASAFVASAALILLFSSEARAVKLLVQVTPTNQQAAGFSVASHQRQDGMIQFTITRDLSKAYSHAPDSNLEVRRSATLKTQSDSGRIAEFQVDAMKQRQTVSFQFVIARDRFSKSTFTVAEIDDHKNNGGGERLLGGGTLFEFRLVDFLAK
jgi:hypothetical protein